MFNWFSFSLQLNRFPIKKAQRAIREIQEIPEKDFSDHVEQKKQEILQHHLASNPFYKEFFGASDYTDWKMVPIMTKRDLQRPLENRLSSGFSAKDVYVSRTSGSSGQPFIFAKDRFCHALTWAEFINRYQWFGIDLNRSVQARFYGIPLDRIGYIKERLKDRFGYRYRFPIFNLNETKMEEFLADFRNKNFDYINGYTSSIVLFAKFLHKKNIILKEVCPNLKLCIVTSEMFFDKDKKLLEAQFAVPVVNEYGASEFGLLAFENPQGEWVLNSETKFVEIVSDQGEVLPYGQEGRIVITSLFNRAHPFIRYDIGDRGIIEPGSHPKKPILKKLLGRTNDIAVLPSGKVVPGLTFYYITKTVIEDDGKVKEFIVQQIEPDRFKVIYVAEMELSQEKLQKIEKALATYLEEGLQVDFQYATFLNRTKRGKLKQFESLL